MKKRISIALITFVSMLLSSCNGLVFNEDKHAETRMETIVSAIKEQDKDTIKSLFSKKATDEAEDWEENLSTLLNVLGDGITSYSMKQAKECRTSAENGKKSIMMTYSFYIITETERYLFLLIDYPMDTKDTNNEGIYMLEIHNLSSTVELSSLQDRMKAGISILE